MFIAFPKLCTALRGPCSLNLRIANRSYALLLRPVLLPTAQRSFSLLQTDKWATNGLKYAKVDCRHLSVGPVLMKGALPFEVDHKVEKDVLLYDYQNKRYFKYLTWFGAIQFFFWTYMAQFAYSSLRDVKTDIPGADSAWWRRINMGENKYKNGIALLFMCVGYFLFFFTTALCLRSVHRIVLMKGGKKVAVQTFAPLGNVRTLEVPTEHISATKSRQASQSSLALKLKGRSFYFLLDGRGKFYNTELFDYVVALQRKF